MREIRTYGSVGTPGGQPPGVTRQSFRDMLWQRLTTKLLKFCPHAAWRGHIRGWETVSTGAAWDVGSALVAV